MSEALVRRAPVEQAQIEALYQRMFQRDPKPVEIEDSLQFVNDSPEDGRTKVFGQLAQILFLSNEFRFLD